MATNIPWGDVKAIRAQSAGLFTATMQRPTALGRLSGNLPTQADAENKLRFQSSNDMPILGDVDDWVRIQGSSFSIESTSSLDGFSLKLALRLSISV